MTARERVEQLIESLSSNYAGHNGNFIPEWTKAYEKDLDFISSALADAERGGMERAAKIAESHRTIEAAIIATAIRAKAQAGEGA